MFPLALESDVRLLVSIVEGGFGDLDICDGDLEGGKDVREGRISLMLPFELVVPFVGGLPA